MTTGKCFSQAASSSSHRTIPMLSSAAIPVLLLAFQGRCQQISATDRRLAGIVIEPSAKHETAMGQRSASPCELSARNSQGHRTARLWRPCEGGDSVPRNHEGQGSTSIAERRRKSTRERQRQPQLGKHSTKKERASLH